MKNSPPPSESTDEEAGFRISERFRRFSQKNDIFSRSFWDPTVRSSKTDKFYESYRRPLKEWRKVDGYHQRDFALRNAAWHVADLFAERLEDEGRREGFLDFLTAQRDGADSKREIESPREMAAEIKKASRLFGADRVGITFYDERWVYTHRYDLGSQGEAPMDLPEDLSSVIVVLPRNGPRSLADRTFSPERHGDRRRVLERRRDPPGADPVHPQPRLPCLWQHERHRIEHPVCHPGRARRVRPSRAADRSRARTAAPDRQDLYRSSPGP